MVGSAILRELRDRDFPQERIVTRSHAELDLRNQSDVLSFLESERPDQVIVAAARVGGIHANDTFPADFLIDNLLIAANVIHGAYQTGVRSLLYLGSSCVYPRLATQPMSEDFLLSGMLEPTNEAYAIAKIAGIKLCESYNRQFSDSGNGVDYRAVIPTNVYGPGDNYHQEHSHVIPAMIRKFHEARTAKAPTVTLWGSGQVRREFMHVSDLARAVLFVMDLPREAYSGATGSRTNYLNIGIGEEITIKDLAYRVRSIIGFHGEIVFDTSKPDGAPRKLLDSARINRLGWRPKIDLETGLQSSYADFVGRHASC